MALFSGRADGLYSSNYGKLTQSDLKIFTAKNGQNTENLLGKNQTGKDLGVIQTPFFKVIESPTSGFFGDNGDILNGKMDICSFEDSSDGGVDFLFGFSPSYITTQRPGLNFLKIKIHPEDVDVLKAYFKKNPKGPYEIMSALFPSGFRSSLDPDFIRKAWREKGKDVFAKIDQNFLSYINKYSGFEIFSTTGSNTPEDLFKRSLEYEENMVYNLLFASKTSRFAPQEKLMMVDLRGVGQAEVGKTYKQKKEIITL